MARKNVGAPSTERRWAREARDQAVKAARIAYPGRSKAAREKRAEFEKRSVASRISARRRAYRAREAPPPASTERAVGAFPGRQFLPPAPALAPEPFRDDAATWRVPRRLDPDEAPPQVLVEVTPNEYREGFYSLSRACEDLVRPSGRNGTVYVFQFREEGGEFRRRRRWQVSRWLDFILGVGETYRASRSQVWTEGGFFLGFAEGQQFSPDEADRWVCPIPEFVFEYDEE